MAKNNPLLRDKTSVLTGNHSRVKHLTFIFLLISLMLGISGCVTLADPEASQDYFSDIVAELNPQTTLGQSFISRRPNLDGITLWLTASPGQTSESNNAVSNTFDLKLFHTAGESTPVFSTTINAGTSNYSVPLAISLPDQKNPSGQNFYLLLTNNSGSIQINGRNEDAYPLGQAFVNENAINADIAFRLSYNYDFSALLDDFKLFSANAWIIAPLLILLWLPGWLLLEISGFRFRFDFGEQTAISIGLSLAIIPIAMLWTTIAKIKWSREVVLFVAGLLTALLIVRTVYTLFISRKNRLKPDLSRHDDQLAPYSKPLKFLSYKSITLILIFLFSLAVRLIMVRDLATPAWVDSVHHALITRLILNAGAYPSTLLPYLDISSTVYHPGFHSIAAAFIWLTNLDLAQSLLILGQVLNALSIFSVYLFTTSLTRSSSAGLFAAFITGFFTPMPAYYTSWGRYTELTGLLILPVLLPLLHLLLDGIEKKKIIRLILLGAIAAGGLFMIHYRVIVFLVGLIILFVLFQFVFQWKAYQNKLLRLLLFIFIMAVIGIASVLPWFIPTIKTTVLPKLNLPASASVTFFQDFSWPYLTSALGKQAMVLAGLGLVWSMIKHRKLAFILSAWLLLLFFLANLDALKLPGGGLITNLSVEIMLFIPISMLGGYALDQILVHWKELIPKQLIIPSIGLLYVLFGFVGYIGAKQLIPIINPITILSRSADLPAIEWVSTHLPENETIVINSFPWGYGLYAGNDGGYWLSPLSGRITLPPPVLYGLGNDADKISNLSKQVVSSSADPQSLWELLHSQQLHYVYTGVRGGVISPEKLAASGMFNVLYHQDGVWIFRVKP